MSIADQATADLSFHQSLRDVKECLYIHTVLGQKSARN